VLRIFLKMSKNCNIASISNFFRQISRVINELGPKIGIFLFFELRNPD
jgi:hypothetical protein